MGAPWKYINTRKLLHRPTLNHWKKKRQDREKAIPLKVWEAEAQVEVGLGKCEGDEIVERAQKMLESGFGLGRSEIQVMVHDDLIYALLPYIFGEHWPLHKERVMKEWNETRTYYSTLIMMGRRQGKTYSVAMYAACMLLLLPGVKIAAFAHLVMLSETMLQTIFDMLKKAFDTAGNGIDEKNFPYKKSKRSITVYHKNGQKSTAFCVPATRTVSLSFSFLSFA